MNKFLFIIIYFMSLSMFSQIQIGQDIDGANIFDEIGASTCLSSDGSILATSGVTDISSVRIFENINETWVQIGQTIFDEAPNDQSKDIALSSDGTIIAIGAPQNDGNGNRSGHVRVFENINGTWAQIGEDIDGEDPDDFAGSGVALSSDGTIVAVGSPGKVVGKGSVRIFENVEDIWTQIGESIEGEAINNFSGEDIALSSDGTIIAIGARGNVHNGISSGHVRVYENINETWVQIGEDIDGEGTTDRFGSALDISSDGNIIAIGAPAANSFQTGDVEIYENINGTWTQIGEDIEGENNLDGSGFSVALSSDGSIVAVGAPSNDGNGFNSGHVRIYQNQNGTWIQIGEDIDGEEDPDQSGFSVALSSSGSIVAIGATQNDGNNGADFNTGHVRVYGLSDVLSISESTIQQFSIYPNPASDIIHITYQEEILIKNITIYNSLGQQVKKSKNSTISTSDLSKGIYILEVVTTTSKSSKKLIIK